MIFCRSRRAAERTREGIIRFIEDGLHLRVNREKTKAAYIRGMKFLGYSFYVHGGECRLSVHPKSLDKFKRVDGEEQRNRIRTTQGIAAPLYHGLA